jgi:phosphoribosylformylglycinamidine cyclo-ligase
VPKLFSLVQDSGNITKFEMARTFNMGIGMVLILRKQDVSLAQKMLKQMRLSSWPIGKIRKAKTKVEVV